MSVTLPSSVLRQRITGRPYLGSTGTKGAAYGEPRTVRARVVGRRRVVRSSTGTQRTSTQTAEVRPGDEFPTQSQVVFEGETYEVAEVVPMQGLSRPAGYQLVLI